MAIKIKHKTPKHTDFGPNDIVINVKDGTIFYKSEKDLFQLQGDNLTIPPNEDLTNFNGSISASNGYFSGGPGIGGLAVEGKGTQKFSIEPVTLEVGGSIIPSSSNAPIYDLGSLDNPWRDVYFSQDSLHFVKQGKGVQFSQIENGFIVDNYGFQSQRDSTTITYTSSSNNLNFPDSGINVSGNITASGNATFGTETVVINGTAGHITASGNISASGIVYGNTGSFNRLDGSSLYITASGQSVIQVGNTGNTLSKWEFIRNGTRKWVFYNDGRTSAIVPQDSMVFKHGTDSDGNEYINMSLSPDDQGVWCHGNITASGTISASGMIQTAGAISSSTGITASDAFFSSHITASGAISASGAIQSTGIMYAGSHGHQTRIKILPTEFKSDQSEPFASGRTNYFFDWATITDGGGSVEGGSTTDDEILYWLGHVPQGYKATKGKINGNATGATHGWFSGSIADNGVVALASSNTTATNTEKTFDTEMTADDDNYIICKYIRNSATNEIHGGYVTIEKA